MELSKNELSLSPKANEPRGWRYARYGINAYMWIAFVVGLVFWPVRNGVRSLGLFAPVFYFYFLHALFTRAAYMQIGGPIIKHKSPFWFWFRTLLNLLLGIAFTTIGIDADH